MKNKFSFVFVYWWMLVLFVAGVALALFAEKEERVSETENRMLSGFPEMTAQSVFSGDFFTGIESYLSDGMFGRDQVVGVSNGILDFFSVNTSEDIQLLDNLKMADELQGIYDDESSAEGDDSSAGQENVETGEDESTDGDAEDSDDGMVDMLEEDAPDSEEMVGYGLWLQKNDGKYRMMIRANEKRIQSVTEILNQYRSKLPEDGNVYYCHVPLARASNVVLEPGKYNGWYDNAGEGVAKYADEGVHYIPAANIIGDEVMGGEHMYYRSDHHWTPRAAVLAVNECLKIQGLPTVDFDEYGYKINIFANSNNEPIELLYPLQDVYGSTMKNGKKAMESPLIRYSYLTYVAFLSGDTHFWEKYETGFSVGRNALVIGDSFSNAFTVYLMPYYDEVNKVDIRHYTPYGLNLSELIEQHDIDDVYIVVSHANGFESKNSYSRLERILNGE